MMSQQPDDDVGPEPQNNSETRRLVIFTMWNRDLCNTATNGTGRGDRAIAPAFRNVIYIGQ